jgi:hypothetical protein
MSTCAFSVRQVQCTHTRANVYIYIYTHAQPLTPLFGRGFNRSDWQYIFTAGAEGTRPEGFASHLFEWAGQFVMKSGYTLEDHWAYFDIGPYGSSGHAHRDKLHLNIRPYGSLVLVDSGRFTYQGDGSIFHSQYAPFTRAHNTFTIDGCNQAAAPATASKSIDNSTWTITDAYDYARGTISAYDDLEGTASHTRAVLYVKGQYWVVVDVIDTDRPRAIQATWHAHPNSSVHVDPHTFEANVTGVPRGAVKIVAATGAHTQWENVSIVAGQQPPEHKDFQGWYSETYLDHRPAPTLIYDAAIKGPSVFAWLLHPSPTAGALPPARLAITDAHAPARSVSVSVTVGSATFTHTIVTTPVP